MRKLNQRTHESDVNYCSINVFIWVLHAGMAEGLRVMAAVSVTSRGGDGNKARLSHSAN